MKVLIVASGNSAAISPFVKEQGDSLKEIGLDIDYFLIKGKGVTGYLKNYFNLIRLVKNNTYDIIHAHYGLSGLLATFQSHVPVVITFHGSDVNLNRTNFYLSFLASRLSDKNIFVHESLSKNYEVSSPKIDDLTSFAKKIGAEGARLTGAGFGGCIVVLVDKKFSEEFLKRLKRKFRNIWLLDKI